MNEQEHDVIVDSVVFENVVRLGVGIHEILVSSDPRRRMAGVSD